MQIRIGYFAALREKRGLAEETLTVSPGSLADLYEGLSAVHGFAMSMRHLRVAKNDTFAAWEDPLSDGDYIVFIPPVAGG